MEQFDVDLVGCNWEIVKEEKMSIGQPELKITVLTSLEAEKLF